MNLRLILLVFAFVLFFLAALPFAPVAPWQPRLIAAGLACAAAALLFG